MSLTRIRLNLQDTSVVTGSGQLALPLNSDVIAGRSYVDTVSINTQSASYILALSDAGKIIETNTSSANTVTIPTNLTQQFPIGTSLDIFQYGTGQTTLVPAVGVVVRASGNKLKLTGQYSAASLYKRDTNEWVIMGDLSA